MSDELERLKLERMNQLMAQQRINGTQGQEAMQQQMQAAEAEKQIKAIINNILTPQARERLANIRLVNPQFARQIEIILIQLYQAGKLPNQLTDAQLKDILRKVKGQRKEINIKRI